MSVKDLINAIASGSAIETEQAFNSVMAEKISARLDDMRIEVAQNMFEEFGTKFHDDSVDHKNLHKHTDKELITAYSHHVKNGVRTNHVHHPDHQGDDANEAYAESQGEKEKAIETHIRSKRPHLVKHIDSISDTGWGESGFSKFELSVHSKAIKAAKNKVNIKEAVEEIEEELTLEDYSAEEVEEFMQTEDYEQLDELSKKTLGDYVKKASGTIQTIDRAAEKSRKDSIEASGNNRPDVQNIHRADWKYLKNKASNRVKGITKAVDKLAK